MIPLLIFYCVLVNRQCKQWEITLSVAFLLGAVITGYFSGTYNQLLGFKEFWEKFLLLVSGLLLLFILHNHSRDYRQRAFYHVTIVFWITGLLFALHGFYQYFFWFPAVEKELPEILHHFDPLIAEHLRNAIRNRRIFSVFGDPNMLALFLLPAIFFTFFHSFPSFLLLNLFFIPAVYMTYSRTGWLALFTLPAAYLLILSLHKIKADVKIISGRFVIIILIFSSAFIIEQGSRRIVSPVETSIQHSFEPADYTNIQTEQHFHPVQLDTWRQRIGYWENALQQFTRRPFIGNGPGSYQLHYLFFKDLSIQETRYAHNIIFQSLAEQGIIGAVFLMLFIFFPFFFFVFQPSYTLPHFFFIWGTFIIFNLLSYYFYHELFFFIFILLLGVSWPGKVLLKLKNTSLKRWCVFIVSLALLFCTFLVSLSRYLETSVNIAVQSREGTQTKHYLELWNSLPIKGRTTVAAVQHADFSRPEKIRFLHDNQKFLEYFPYGCFLLSLYYYEDEQYIPALKYAMKAHIQYPYKAVYIEHLMNIYRDLDNHDKVVYWEKKYTIAQHNFQ